MEPAGVQNTRTKNMKRKKRSVIEQYLGLNLSMPEFHDDYRWWVWVYVESGDEG